MKFATIISIIFLTSITTFAQVKVIGVDSASQRLPVLSTDSLKTKVSVKIDSLRDLTSQRTKLNAIQHKASAKLDSLKTLVKLPVVKIPGDSLRQNPQSAIAGLNEKVNGAASDVQNKTDSLGKKITGTTDRIKQGIEGKVEEITGEKVSIPDEKLPAVPGIKVPGIETGNAPAISPDLPVLNGQPLPDTKLPSISTDIPKTDKIDQPALTLPKVADEVKVPGEIGQLKQETDKAGERLKEVQQYEDEVKAVQEQGLKDAEKLPEEAEKKVADLSEVQGAKKGIGAATAKQQEYEAMIQRYKDKKLVQSEMKRKMTNVVNDQLNQLSPEIKDAQASLAKSKKVYSEANSMSSALKKKKTNAMEGKTFGQRLVPGLTFQAYNRSVYSMDFGLQLGYRFTGRLTTGIGGTYRTGFSKSYDSFVKGLDVYGGRVYTDFLVRKGFFLHGEFEMLHTGDFVTRTVEIPDARVWGSNIGIGKQYNLTKRIKGSVIALYRLEFNGHLPEQSKVNLRMGFDLKARKKKKITESL